MDAERLFSWADGRVRVDRTLLYPPFLAKVDAMLAACEARGRRYYAIRGFATFAEQAAVDAAGPIAAPAGLSQHNYGLAVDFNLDEDMAKAGLQLPNTPRVAKHFKVLVEEARKHGLHSGADYSDSPHVGWPGFVSGRQLGPLKVVWARTIGDDRARLAAVWRRVAGSAA